MYNLQGLTLELFRLLFSVGGVIYLLYGFFVEFRAYRKGTFRPDVRYIVFGGISRLALLSACIWIFLFGPYDDIEAAFGISIPSSHATLSQISGNLFGTLANLIFGAAALLFIVKASLAFYKWRKGGEGLVKSATGYVCLFLLCLFAIFG